MHMWYNLYVMKSNTVIKFGTAMRYSVLAVVVVLFLCIFFVFKFGLFGRVGKTPDFRVPSPTPEQIKPSPEVTPNYTLPITVGPDGWQKVSFDTPYYFRPFLLYFTSTWKFDIEKTSLQDVSFYILSLTKGNNKIFIRQTEGDAGDCYYPGEHDKAWGMAKTYDSYFQIKKGGLIWRIAKQLMSGQATDLYSVCEYVPTRNVFGGFTKIGSIFLESPQDDPKILGEFDEILRRIEIK